MGVYRQLMRRPALPFLLIVSCLLITSPLWLTKQVATASLVLVMNVILQHGYPECAGGQAGAFESGPTDVETWKSAEAVRPAV